MAERQDKNLRPMKASEVELDKLDKLRWPLWVSPKYDGIRAIVVPGQDRPAVVVSNTLKPIPSKYVQDKWGRVQYIGFDGELICGEPYTSGVYQRTFSAVMTHGSNVPVNFYVFDLWNEAGSYELRFDRLVDKVIDVGERSVVLVDQMVCTAWERVLQWESSVLDQGFEGIMLRNPNTEYKFGRSTFLEQALLKLKRYSDAEAEIVGAEELYHNYNPPTVDARGLTVRSSHMENKQQGGILGALIVKDCKTGATFKVGTGFTTQQRESMWKEYLAGDLQGRIIKYGYFNYGIVDLPRHPKFLGFRSPQDM